MEFHTWKLASKNPIFWILMSYTYTLHVWLSPHRYWGWTIRRWLLLVDPRGNGLAKTALCSNGKLRRITKKNAQRRLIAIEIFLVVVSRCADRKYAMYGPHVQTVLAIQDRDLKNLNLAVTLFWPQIRLGTRLRPASWECISSVTSCTTTSNKSNRRKEQTYKTVSESTPYVKWVNK